MTDLTAALLAEARRRHPVILPCATRKSLEDCVVDHGEYGVFLYYNTPDGNTHCIRAAALPSLA